MRSSPKPMTIRGAPASAALPIRLKRPRGTVGAPAAGPEAEPLGRAEVEPAGEVPADPVVDAGV